MHLSFPFKFVFKAQIFSQLFPHFILNATHDHTPLPFSHFEYNPLQLSAIFFYMFLSIPKIMKFEDFLMDPTAPHQRKLDLQGEVRFFLSPSLPLSFQSQAHTNLVFLQVLKLEEQLHGEQQLNKALHWALHGPFLSHPHVSSSLPPQVRPLCIGLSNSNA